MVHHSIKGACIALAIAFLCLVPKAAIGGHMAVSQKADGTQVYIGFMLTRKLVQSAQLNPRVYGAHGTQPVPLGRHKYHMIIAVFDTASGKRITDAKLKVRIAPLAFGASFVDLVRMETAGAVGYCGFFDMPPHDLYIIDLRIKRRDRAEEITMRFKHEPPCCGKR